MSIILPYEQKLIYENVIGPEGAFVFPDGKIEIVNTFPQDAYYYIKNCLNEKEYSLWEKWDDKPGTCTFQSLDKFSSFLLQVCGIDMISVYHYKTIITTNPCPYIKYFNYYLNDFILEYHFSRKLDENKETFEAYDKKCSEELLKKNMQFKKDADNIKEKVLKKDLHKYYRH